MSALSVQDRAAARAAKRQAPKVSARYDAAGTGRRVISWNPPSTGPRTAVEGLERLRNRSHDSIRNDWAARSANQKWTTNLIGVGITPRWDDEQFNQDFAQFAEQCDADGVLDLFGMQALGVRSVFAGGEVFVRRRWRDLRLPLPAPVQFQLIEAAQVPLWNCDNPPAPAPVGNRVRQGIELNKRGARVAYWMFPEHPGDSLTGGQTIDPTKMIRVPAAEISHVFEPTRPGQMRGVPDMAAVLVRLRQANIYEDNVLDRQALANLFVAFVTRQMPDNWADLKLDSNGFPAVWTEDNRPTLGLKAGVMQELAPGEKVDFANPPEAGTTYSDYLRTTNLGTAAGDGLPYEILSGDIKDISDRTLRIVIQEFRRLCQQRQWHMVIPMLCKPMARWWADAMVFKGAYTPAQAEAAAKPAWHPHGWEYIHPVQDVQGKVMERDANLRSTSEIIAQRGDDPRKVLAQIKADEASGLTPKPDPVAAPAQKQQVQALMSQLQALLAGED